MNQGEKRWSYEAVPADATRLFRMSWQLEEWLRLMVYVELSAACDDWQERVARHVRRWPPDSLEADKRLHHMATPHQGALSYLSFGELWAVIADVLNWSLFEPYLPPKENVTARIGEIKAIRNRVAHCRSPHENDPQRMDLFLRDLDPGVRRFCSRYTVPVQHPADDQVASQLSVAWEKLGHATELFNPQVGWLYAPGDRRIRPTMGAQLEYLVHPSGNGLVYKLTLRATGAQSFRVASFLESTVKLHTHVIHIIAESDAATVTISARKGPADVLALVCEFLQAGRDSVWPGDRSDIDRIQGQWPEYVLMPNHPLALFTEDYHGMTLDLS